jgi:hypothetical protein
VSFNSLQIFSSIEIGDETLAPLTGVDGDYYEADEGKTTGRRQLERFRK